MTLRDLDERVVPRAAVRLQALLARTRRAPRPARAARPERPATSSAAGALRRLDDRFTRRGPLRVLRVAPWTGLVLAAAVLLAGATVALTRDDGVPAAAPTSAVLGPPVGSSVDAYVAGARARAVDASRRHPAQLQLALVSLSVSLTPAQAADLLGGLDVRRAYLRVPGVAAAEVLPADVHDLVGDLRVLYAATAQRKATEQEQLRALARSIAPVDPERARFRDFYAASARLAGQAATAYRTGCACLFAAVVRGRADQLAELPALQGVRAVELAPPGLLLAQLRVQPLTPEQQGTVRAEVPGLPEPAPAAWPSSVPGTTPSGFPVLSPSPSPSGSR